MNSVDPRSQVVPYAPKQRTGLLVLTGPAVKKTTQEYNGDYLLRTTEYAVFEHTIASMNLPLGYPQERELW